MNINNMIKSVRCARRLSVKELSQKADISTKFLYDIEAGKRGVSYITLYKIASALNVTCDYLILGEERNISNELISVLEQLDIREQKLLYTMALEIIKLRECEEEKQYE